MKRERRVINISKEAFDTIKKYCDDNSLRMSQWIETQILKIIQKRK